MAAPNHVKLWLSRPDSIHDIQHYVSSGCETHPLLFDHMMVQLDEMSRRGKVCLTPSAIFHLYHRKFRKAA